jgi:serine/threonine protein kinase
VAEREHPEHPEFIGPYRILARIGAGGSGQVFLAEQDEPVRRRVALKIVPAAALSPELAGRFDVERRALECTDHPGIARILDAGRTSDGMPYLVMDHVEGD